MSPSPYKYYIINKPFNMVSQFVSPDDVGLLGDLDFDFPEGIHAIGRLDNHSEGLLILTTNKRVTKLLFESKTPHERTYLVMVRHRMTQETLEKLRTGVTIIVKGGVDYTTPPCDVQIVDMPEGLFEGNFKMRPDIPHTWLTITLTEGKFHQVRKMVFAVSHRCIRLIRISIEDLLLGDLQPGCVKEIEETEFFKLLQINNWQLPKLNS
ncbi:pseudouridine synthase [Flavipsychrobacter stenotrophus]|uniref:Pseudouridine synthase n=1 Tax=Flavipsychrobacter stenotrophus TaxID=2077091 RepID=A0A2S7STZ6_9BACT|nr:pseudouridine synthase [Flavipsychrobacter stenotrophus]PQJ10065.1 pseudouridine synthase [Flavipsychrobacter stenotrophus]